MHDMFELPINIGPVPKKDYTYQSHIGVLSSVEGIQP